MVEGSDFAGVIEDYRLKVDVDEVMDRKQIIVERMIEKELTMIDGAMEMLAYTDQFHRGAVTSADEREMYAKLNRFGLAMRFEAFVFAEMTKKSKPDPEPYAMGADLIKLRPSDIFVLEDASRGIESARLAGCITIALSERLHGRHGFQCTQGRQGPKRGR